MYPKNIRYTKTHEWVRLENGVAIVGITSYACEELSDIVYAELPSEGTQVEAGTTIATLESVKAVSQVYTPVAGMIDSVNVRLREEPSLLNEDPYGAGWIVRLRPTAESSLDDLMDSESYERFTQGE